MQRDLESRGVADRVLVHVWSEFGRRVAENGSQGTDHGSAGLGFLIGTQVNGKQLSRVLQGVMLDLAPVILESAGATLTAATTLMKLLAARGQQKTFAGNFGLDDLGNGLTDVAALGAAAWSRLVADMGGADAVTAAFFDATSEPMVTAKTPGPGKDILEASANNLYVNVSSRDLEGFTERFGLNSRLVKQADGTLVEEVYRVGGKYHAEISRIVGQIGRAHV
mgnify:CR=1 FL=1